MKKLTLIFLLLLTSTLLGPPCYAGSIRKYVCTYRDIFSGSNMTGRHEVTVDADLKTAKITAGSRIPKIIPLERLETKNTETYFTHDSNGRLNITFDISPGQETGVLFYRLYVCKASSGCEWNRTLEGSTQIFICPLQNPDEV